MKALYWLGACAAMAAGLATGAGEAKKQVLLVTGDTAGYLSPCGCVSPMTGGIRRRATALKALSVSGRTTIVDNGGLVTGVGRQDQVKAEALAEAIKLTKVNAVNLGMTEARLGSGMVGSLNRLSGKRFLSSSLAPSETNELPQTVKSGPFLIGAVEPDAEAMAPALRENATPTSLAVRALLDEAARGRLVPVLMTRGDEASARKLAEGNPKLRLIVYRNDGNPPTEPVRVGETLLVTPGDRGKHLVRLEWDGKAFGAYRLVALGPEYEDDPVVARVFKRYVARVGDEKLIEQLPRVATATYVGAEACMRCHADAGKAWQKTGHARALSSLEKVGQDRDPECVGCHVTGLESESGFRSRAETPKLADVGCESCHGPSGHSKKTGVSPAKAREQAKAACGKCHNPDHSPKFDFDMYWPKVSH